MLVQPCVISASKSTEELCTSKASPAASWTSKCSTESTNWFPNYRPKRLSFTQNRKAASVGASFVDTSDWPRNFLQESGPSARGSALRPVLAGTLTPTLGGADVWVIESIPPGSQGSMHSGLF